MFFTKLAEKTGILDYLAPPSNVERDNLEAQDAAFARQLQNEENRRQRRIRAQYDSERAAEKKGLFAKKQRVLYHHISTGAVYDAVIVGVHFDDGPDRPYYTIKYTKPKKEVSEDGNETVTLIEIEKQTDPERVKQLPWDEDKTWEILQ